MKQVEANSDASSVADRIESFLQRQPRYSAGNKAIRLGLKLSESRYWPGHRRLVEDGRAIRGRGKGGSLVLVAAEPVAAPSSPSKPGPLAPATESGWYPYIAQVLEKSWRLERGFDELVVSITAHQGRRSTGGRWTRPDLAAVALHRSRFVPHDGFSLWTFEVKRLSDLDVTAVYEALAHARAATHAVVLACVDMPEEEVSDTSLAQVLVEAKRHGVGLWFIRWPVDFDTWEPACEPAELSPGMAALDDFIGGQMRPFAEQIGGWFRR